MRRWVLVVVALLMMAGIGACDLRPPPPTRTRLIVNTLPPSLTPERTATAVAQISSIPRRTPSRTPVPPATRTRAVTQSVRPQPTPVCNDAPPTRLILGERGRVLAEDPRPLNVRSGPGTDYRIFGRLEVMEVFVVVDGPMCGDGYAWFKIQRGILEGWIAEGDLGIYYVEPFLPG
ncbi:MAG: SH3 domain-containing protein [bacterium]|nr:SH3 domain-containing protein [bacterium]